MIIYNSPPSVRQQNESHWFVNPEEYWHYTKICSMFENTCGGGDFISCDIKLVIKLILFEINKTLVDMQHDSSVRDVNPSLPVDMLLLTQVYRTQYLYLRVCFIIVILHIWCTTVSRCGWDTKSGPMFFVKCFQKFTIVHFLHEVIQSQEKLFKEIPCL